MNNDTNTHARPAVASWGLRVLGFLLAAGLLLAACSTDSTDTATTVDQTEDGTETTVVTADTVEVAADDATPEDVQAPPADGGPPGGQPGRPGSQEPQDSVDDGTLLTTGPQNVGEHGPFSNADFDGDGTVTLAELDAFMDGALEREIGLVAFFELNDANSDDVLDADELAVVDPAYAFDGTDANSDGLVSLSEVEDYANEEGRSYRAIGLGEFFDLVDADDDDEVSPEEIEAAHESGLLARY